MVVWCSRPGDRDPIFTWLPFLWGCSLAAPGPQEQQEGETRCTRAFQVSVCVTLVCHVCGQTKCWVNVGGYPKGIDPGRGVAVAIFANNGPHCDHCQEVAPSFHLVSGKLKRQIFLLLHPICKFSNWWGSVPARSVLSLVRHDPHSSPPAHPSLHGLA